MVVPEVAVTSEIASEVELAPEVELNILITFSVSFKSFNQSLTPVVKTAARKLKQAFGVRQGFAGRTLKVEGTEMEWKTFVQKYFGISTRRFNQILEIEDEEATPKERAPKSSGSGMDDSLAQQVAELDERLQDIEEENDALKTELEQLKADPVAVIVADWPGLPMDEVEQRYLEAWQELQEALDRCREASTSAVVEDEEIEPLLDSQ